MRDLHLIYVRHHRRGNAGEISAHAVRYYDLTMVLKGPVSYQVDGQQVLLEDGDAVFIPKGSVRYRADSQSEVNYISFNFETAIPPQLPALIRGGVNRQVQLLIASFDEISAGSYLDLREKTEHLLSCILLILEDHVKTAGYNPLTLQIMDFIHSHYTQRITLAQIGELTSFSPVYCDTVFRQEVGRSIINYLIDTRIDAAKKLLIGGGLSIAAVAERTGFQDANYFCRVFKKRTGDTPGGYQKRLGSR